MASCPPTDFSSGPSRMDGSHSARSVSQSVSRYPREQRQSTTSVHLSYRFRTSQSDMMILDSTVPRQARPQRALPEIERSRRVWNSSSAVLRRHQAWASAQSCHCAGRVGCGCFRAGEQIRLVWHAQAESRIVKCGREHFLEMTTRYSGGERSVYSGTERKEADGSVCIVSGKRSMK